MKTTLRLLITILLLTTASGVPAAAQVPTAATPDRFRVTFRAGLAHHTADPAGGLPGNAPTLAAEISSGHFVIGTAFHPKDSSDGSNTAYLKAGAHGEGRRLAMSIHLTAGYRWDTETPATLFGIGSTADLRLIGPLNMFVGFDMNKPVIKAHSMLGERYRLTHYAQGLLTWGVSIRI
jgi:hypothetical protein